ncbi:substrate-binding domain-containing protein [Kribbella solani]|uniref:D-xylose transport system substrate-binding protein n=2 Tax=Kribbella solani TaxID=236067 RepID=A0A841DIQ1_9ACTN|nr:substrate-binding domain-containing protein [Kribbella solani]MBB5978443.1 D-xylose transport system substrate-binding protein [Kribbella solani]
MGQAAVGLSVLLVAGCGGGGTSPSSQPSASSSPPALSVSSFDLSFAAMSKLTSTTAAGKGKVGVILPDTTSSTRYIDFDAPYIEKALKTAGYSAGDYKIDNAQGVDATELALAQADIAQGASVLIFDPIDSTVGAQVQAYAASHGVALISYDRATFTGTNTYYVSFDNVQVGKLIGAGFNACVKDWHVTAPKVFQLDGGQDTDPNAVSFAQGYNSKIWGTETTPLPAGTKSSTGYTLIGDKITPGWVNAVGATIFTQQFTAHPEINATVEANDGLANAVVTVLKNKGVGAKKIPTTGQDATIQGMTNILQGYQCGSVYKPIYLEAQDAVALATYLRAKQTPPATLVNSTTTPPKGVAGNKQPASLLTPVWVTSANLAKTVIKDKFIDAKALCATVSASVCTAAGITP